MAQAHLGGEIHQRALPRHRAAVGAGSENQMMQHALAGQADVAFLQATTKRMDLVRENRR